MTAHPAPGPQTLGDALSEAVRRRGDAPFILHGDDAMSYRQLDAASRRVAASLLRLGRLTQRAPCTRRIPRIHRSGSAA